MKGLYFAQMVPDQNIKGRVNVKLGYVREQIGAERFLCEFNGPKFNFLSILPAAEMGNFMFFDSVGARNDALQALVQPDATPQENPPSSTESP